MTKLPRRPRTLRPLSGACGGGDGGDNEHARVPPGCARRGFRGHLFDWQSVCARVSYTPAMDPQRPPQTASPVEQAIASLYDELRAVAARQLRRERPDHTLQPTALVHEAYLRMADQHGLQWESRLHFLHIASAQIRRILVDHARSRSRLKRGGDLLRVTLSEALSEPDRALDLLELDDALRRLDRESEEDRQIVELKFFGGLTEPEIGVVLGMSERTVRRRWLFARTWLFHDLAEQLESDENAEADS